MIFKFNGSFLKWCCDPPDKPGLYWRWSNRNELPQLIYVERLPDGSLIWPPLPETKIEETETESILSSTINNTILKDTASSETYVLPLNNQDLEKTKDNINTLHLKLNIDFLGEPDELVEEVKPIEEPNPGDCDPEVYPNTNLPSICCLFSYIADHSNDEKVVGYDTSNSNNDIVSKYNDENITYGVSEKILFYSTNYSKPITDVEFHIELEKELYAKNYKLIYPLFFIPKGTKKCIVNYCGAFNQLFKDPPPFSGDCTFQVFTKDGYHLAGTPPVTSVWLQSVSSFIRHFNLASKYSSYDIDNNSSYIIPFFKKDFFPKFNNLFESNISYKIPNDNSDISTYSKMIGEFNAGRTTDIEQYYFTKRINKEYYRESDPTNKMTIGYSGSAEYINELEDFVSNDLLYKLSVGNKTTVQSLLFENVTEDLIVVTTHIMADWFWGSCIIEPDLLDICEFFNDLQNNKYDLTTEHKNILSPNVSFTIDTVNDTSNLRYITGDNTARLKHINSNSKKIDNVYHHDYITPIFYISKGTKNIQIYTVSGSAKDTINTGENNFCLQIFTKDGYHLAGTPLDYPMWSLYNYNYDTIPNTKDYLEQVIFKKTNMFKSGITYKLPTINTSDTPNYKTLIGKFNDGELDVTEYFYESGITNSFYRESDSSNIMNITYSGNLSYIYSKTPFDIDTYLKPVNLISKYYIDNVIEDLIIVGMFARNRQLYAVCGKENIKRNNICEYFDSLNNDHIYNSPNELGRGIAHFRNDYLYFHRYPPNKILSLAGGFKFKHKVFSYYSEYLNKNLTTNSSESGIGIVSYIPKNSKNVEIYNCGYNILEQEYFENPHTKGDDTFQIFTKDGYHIVGTPLTTKLWNECANLEYGCSPIDALNNYIFKDSKYFNNGASYKLPDNIYLFGDLNTGYSTIEEYKLKSGVTKSYYNSFDTTNLMNITYTGSFSYIDEITSGIKSWEVLTEDLLKKRIFIDNVIEDLVIITIHCAGGVFWGKCGSSKPSDDCLELPDDECTDNIVEGCDCNEDSIFYCYIGNCHDYLNPMCLWPCLSINGKEYIKFYYDIVDYEEKEDNSSDEEEDNINTDENI